MVVDTNWLPAMYFFLRLVAGGLVILGYFTLHTELILRKLEWFSVIVAVIFIIMGYRLWVVLPRI